MSIIYDALEKAGKDNPDKTPPPKPNSNLPIFVPIGLVILVILGIYYFKTRIKELPSIRARKKETRSMSNVKKSSKYNLEGIIYDEEDAFAVINGESVGINEAINGARVVNISSDGVELDTGSERIFLSLK